MFKVINIPDCNAKRHAIAVSILLHLFQTLLSIPAIIKSCQRILLHKLTQGTLHIYRMSAQLPYLILSLSYRIGKLFIEFTICYLSKEFFYFSDRLCQPAGIPDCKQRSDHNCKNSKENDRQDHAEQIIHHCFYRLCHKEHTDTGSVLV